MLKIQIYKWFKSRLDIHNMCYRFTTYLLPKVIIQTTIVYSIMFKSGMVDMYNICLFLEFNTI